MKALILAALLAAPTLPKAQIAKDKAVSAALLREQIYSRPLVPPGAVETLTLPLSGRAMASDGTVFTFTGSVVLTIETKPPTPTPVVTKVTGLRDPVSGALVSTAAPGQRLVLEGELLTSETFLLAAGGERSQVVSSSPTRIEFVVPPVPAGKPPVLILYWLIANNWVEKGRLPLTVTTSPTPTPTPVPQPGANPRLGSVQSSGGQVVITGSGFGAAAGRVLLDKVPLANLSWSDTRIAGTPPALPNLSRVLVDLWRPAEGWYTELWTLPSAEPVR